MTGESTKIVEYTNEGIKSDHCISPNNYELYRKISQGKVIKVSACCGEGCNSYRLNTEGLIEWYEELGATEFKGTYSLDELPRTAIKNIFKKEDPYIWCDCKEFGGEDCIFKEENVNRDKGYVK